MNDIENRGLALDRLDQEIDSSRNELVRYAFGTLHRINSDYANTENVQDVLGEAVLTATQIIRASDGAVPDSFNGFRFWLRRIISFKCLETVRKLTKDRILGRNYQEYIDVIAQESWLDLLDRKDQIETLTKAIASIDANSQAVIEMAFFQDMTTTEIASAMDKEPATIRQIKSRALKKIRRHLSKSGV